MSALCPDCGWSGKATEVVDGGRCPVCRTKINWVNGSVDNVVIHQRIDSVADFNRSAFTVLSAANISRWGIEFLASIKRPVERGAPLTDGQQQSLYKLVNRHCQQLHNRAVLDFAANHAREAD